MKIKLAKHLEPLLEVPSADKYPWWFALFLDPRYVNLITDVRKIHEIDTVYTSNIINEMMPNFYEYIVVGEFA